MSEGIREQNYSICVNSFGLSSEFNFIQPKKWKKYMMEILTQMIYRFQKHKLLLTDLSTIVKAIPEESFVEATLEIRPFRPEFMENIPLLANGSVSTLDQTIAKAARFKNDKKKTKKEVKKNRSFTEVTLHKEFNRPYHPFRFIIKNFRRLLELKLKSLIDQSKVSMEEVQAMLKTDLNVVTEFLKEAALPYQRVFTFQSLQEQGESIEKLKNFIQHFVLDHEKIHATLKKIIIYASRFFYQKQLEQKIEDYVRPQEFDIPEQFCIDGCYIRSINSLMEFTIGNHAEGSLKKLIQLRNNILNDIDEYYRQKTGESQELQVCAQVQIEILRFVVAKLKGWSAEILGQLRFLEVIYGEEDIAYKFDDASFLYAQLIMVFEIVGLE